MQSLLVPPTHSPHSILFCIIFYEKIWINLKLISELKTQYFCIYKTQRDFYILIYWCHILSICLTMNHHNNLLDIIQYINFHLKIDFKYILNNYLIPKRCKLGIWNHTKHKLLMKYHHNILQGKYQDILLLKSFQIN